MRAWLEQSGFNPSAEQEKTFTFENEATTKLVHLSTDDLKPDKPITFNDGFHKDVPMLIMTALAIAPGTWKGYTFTDALIDTLVPLYEGVNIVENHTFDEPADVKGVNLKQQRTAEGIETTSAIFNKNSIASIKSGKFDSVSSNFLLEVNDDDLVLKGNKVNELTLTGDPAVAPALIKSTQDMDISLDNKPKWGDYTPIMPSPVKAATPLPIQIPIISGVNLAQEPTTNNQPPTTEGVDKMTKEENTSVQLEDMVKKLQAELEVREEQAKKQAAVFEAMNTEINARREQERVQKVETRLSEFVKTGKILPAQFDNAKALYLSLTTDEQQALFEKIMSANKEIPLERQGYAEYHDPAQQGIELTADVIDEIETGKLHAQFDATARGDWSNYNPVPQSQGYVPLPTSNGPALFDVNGNVIGGQ